MKLLYVCSDFGVRPAGTKGASIHLRCITRALCDRNHRVQLLSPHLAPGRDHPATPLLPPARCPPRESAGGLRDYLKSHDLPEAVASEIRALLYNQWVAPRAIEALKFGPPDAIIERLSLFGCVGVTLARALKRPLVIEVNAILTREARRFRHLDMGTLAERIELHTLHEAAAVTVVSKQLGDALSDMGVDRAKITVVPNGADVQAFRPDNDGRLLRERLRLNGGFVVGFVGSLKPWHGVDVLIAAFERLRACDPAAILLIVGAGPTERQLREQVAAVGLQDAVTFTGAVEHIHIPGYLGIMDVAVAPFRRLEDFYFSPIKLFEYMAAGRCVVASRLGQIEEVITHGETGFLCPPDDSESLASALLTVRGDAPLRRRLGAAARGRAERNLTWQVAAAATSELIAGLIAEMRPDGVHHQGQPAGRR